MEVSFYSSSSGTSYVEEFIEELPPKTIKKITRQLELLEKHGMNFVTHSGTMKKLHGYDMYEILINFNKISYRILCVIKNACCWLLHIFVKKSNSTPQRQINTALERARDLNLRLAIT